MQVSRTCSVTNETGTYKISLEKMAFDQVLILFEK